MAVDRPPMKIHVLGTAGYHPNETRQTACVMVPESGIILDAGSGFFRVRDLIATPDLHILLSHAHLDHCVGLSYWLDVTFEKNVERICVYGEAEKLDAVKGLFATPLFPLFPDFEWVAIEAGSPVTLTGSFAEGPTIQPIALTHPGGSLGFRLDWPDRSFAYISDTTASESAAYVQAISGVDLLLHECHFPDGFAEMAERTGHSCLTEVAQISRAANVGRTVLIHLNPLLETPMDLGSARQIFPALTVGEDRMVLEL